MNGCYTKLLSNLAVVLSFYLLLFFIFYFSVALHNPGLLSERSFLNWDSQHYFSIVQNGYQPYSTAFFPLFPLSWKLLGFSPIAISIVNGLVFIFSFSILATAMSFTRKELLLCSSVPCLMFMFLPYTEAFFFACTTLLLAGYYRNNLILVALGFFLCGLCRPVSYFFLPAMIITEIFLQSDRRIFYKRVIIFSSCIAVSLFVTLYIQYVYTGEWFDFFKSQEKWDNHFRIPSFPLTSWAGGKIVSLDASALLAGMLAALASLFLLRNKIVMKRKESISPSVLFSLIYLAEVAVFVLFFRGGSLFSLNRFVYATAFFSVALVWFLRSVQFSMKWWSIFLVASNVFWLLFASYVHIQVVLYFFALSVFLSLFYLSAIKGRIGTLFLAILLLLSASLQVYFFYRFLSYEWVA